MQEAQRLTKEFRKSKKQDKTTWILDTMRANLDLRDRWLGIRRLRKGYQAKPYQIHDMHGRPVPLTKRAEAAADYLEHSHWHSAPGPPHTHRASPLLPPSTYNLGPLTLEELDAAIHRTKPRKAPGHDGIKNEYWRILDSESRQAVLPLLNQGWDTGHIHRETALAKVVQIFKQGNTAYLANYRPTSLLNTLYNIYNSILHDRLAAGIDPHLTKHQYGFRKARSTRQAVHILRRIIEEGESTTTNTIFTFLDWETAFDWETA
jgi:hypothetical protein